MGSLEKLLFFGALPAVIAASLIEAVLLSRRAGYDWAALRVSLLDQAVRLALNVVLPLSLASPVIAYAWEHRIATVDVSTWQAIAILFIGQELCYYWFHRFSHRVRWFWGNHSVHHTPNQLNLSAAYRFGWVGKLAGTPLFFMPLVWLGFPVNLVLSVLALNLLYQFWLHATWIPKLGWLEWVLNTPSAHRVHHAANPEYIDANYGGVLIVFDRLFGTYRAERDDLPCRYGLVHPVQDHNLLQIEFGRWIELWRDLKGARSVREFFGYLVMPPGWQPARIAALPKTAAP